jgi:hypothetical protein
MNCKRTKRAVKSLICGENAETTLIQDHLSACPRCRRKYASLLAIVRSAEPPAVSQMDETAWANFSARLRRRISQEQPAPFGSLRSVLLWLGQSKLMYLRRAAALSAAVFAIAVSLNAVFSPFSSRQVERTRIVTPSPSEAPAPIRELPLELRDVIYDLGPGGFVTGVFSGYIQPGDFYGGHELNPYEIVEALDYFLG